MKIAVVTGASSGLGKEFVKKLASDEQYEQIWIIARRRERLLETELKFGKKIVPMVLDLTNPDDLEAYRQKLAIGDYNVGILINCAGFGKFGAYDEIALSSSLNMIDLNCKALVFMSEATIPFMQEGAKILQVASIAAFQPIPRLNVYAATKAFVLNYSLALRDELKDKSIGVFALCPGWIRTEFFNNSGNEKGVVTHFNKWFTADEIASCAMKALKKGKKGVIIPSFKNKAQCIAVKLCPKRFVIWVWNKQQKHK